MDRIRLAFCVLVIGILPIIGAAQEEQATPVVAAARLEKVRFAGASSSVQIRIEVRSAGGDLVYDSDWRDGNIFDWLPRDSSGHPLAFGAYRLMMQSKNLVGQTSEREAVLRVDSVGAAIEDELSTTPRIIFAAHDGDTGELITTSGDLSFRFGDFLHRKDTEAMRLTPAGELRVNGLIHAGGVMFPDGTLLTSASGTAADAASERKQNAVAAERGAAPQSPPIIRGAPLVAPAARLAPRPTFVPGYQFVMDELGVTIGTTNTQYKLDVAGTINTGKEYYIGGTRFIHNYAAVNQNTYVGVNAGRLPNNGSRNVGNGYAALSGSSSGTDNTAIGAYSLTNFPGDWNTAVGAYTLSTNSGGNYNTAVGYFALQATFPAGSEHGSSNTAVGANAMASNTTGNFNVALGQNAGLNMTTGNSNIVLGYGAGQNLTGGYNNIDIGNSGVAAETGIIRIGTSGTHTKAFIAGISGVTLGPSTSVVIDSNGQLGSIPSSRRYKFDIGDMGEATDWLMRLRPVTFRYRSLGDHAPLQFGLIAEEVAEIYPDLVTRNNDGEIESVMYQYLAPMLLNEVQKQRRTIDELNAMVTQLAHRVEQLEGGRN